MDVDHIKLRASAIRMPQNDLARLANIDRVNLSKIMLGKVNPLVSTYNAIDAALRAEERRLLGYLSTLLQDEKSGPAPQEPPLASNI